MTRKATGGYPLPDILDVDSYLCLKLQIPNRPEYVSAIKGAISTMGLWFSWQRDDEQGGKIASEIWRKVIYETLQIGECEMCCCDDVALITQQVTSIRNTINFNNNNVTNYYTNYALKRDEYQASSNPVLDLAPNYVIPTTSGNSAMCQAIDEFIAQSLQIVIEQRERDEFYAGLLSIALIVGSAIVTAGSSLAIGLALGSAGAGIGQLFSGLAITILQDMGARNEVKCLMYSRLKDSEPTLGNLVASLAPIGGLSTNAELIRATLVGLASNEDVHMGFLDRLNELYPLALSGLLEDCSDCNPTEVPYWAVSTPGINVVSSTDTLFVFDIVGAPKGITRRYLPSDALAPVTVNSMTADGYLGVDVYIDGVFVYGGSLAGFNALLPLTGTFSVDMYNDVRVTLNFIDV